MYPLSLPTLLKNRIRVTKYLNKNIYLFIKKIMTTPEDCGHEQGTDHDDPPPGQEVGVGPAPRPPPAEVRPWAGDGAGLISVGWERVVVLGPRKLWLFYLGVDELPLAQGVLCASEGFSHSAIVLDDGRALTCGTNDRGELGRHTLPLHDPYRRYYASVTGINNAIGVACGTHSTIVVMGDGSAVGFGANNSGQLGIGAEYVGRRDVLAPGRQVRGGVAIVAVALGEFHTLFLMADGTVAVAGSFNGGPVNSIPVTVDGIGNVISIAAGDKHNAVVTADGRVATWGDNELNVLGHDVEELDRPTFIEGINDAQSVACGKYMTAIVHGDGRVSVCGDNDDDDEEMPSSYLGLGDDTVRAVTFQVIPGLRDVTAVSISAADRYEDCFVLALHRNGEVSIFGNKRRLLPDLDGEISIPEKIERFNAFRV
jgi:alpha-tubulin suppressor-like RCC1 family protein